MLFLTAFDAWHSRNSFPWIKKEILVSSLVRLVKIPIVKCCFIQVLVNSLSTLPEPVKQGVALMGCNTTGLPLAALW